MNRMANDGVMDRKELLEKLREYNKSINTLVCSDLEKEYIKTVNEKNFYYYFPLRMQNTPKDVETFLKKNHNFSHLLKENHEKLCFFLRKIQNYTCNRTLIRMDARSKNFEYYAERAKKAISGFYVFYGLGLDLKDVVYGKYRQFPFHVEFASVIATEIMQGNQEVIQYCKDVILSENNTAVITRDLIMAIEQADNAELHKLLLDLFVAAKLQEGLRQSVIETVDEYQVSVFLSVIQIIKEQELLRYSSVQRGIMTWIGIGYEIVEEKQIKMIFECLYDFLQDKELILQGLQDENPLKVYLALYCIGIYDVDEAIAKAIELLEDRPRHIVAAALIYLKMTRQFSVVKYRNLVDKYADDEWVCALFFSECAGKDFESQGLKLKEVKELFGYILRYVQEMKPQGRFVSKGFEWFALNLQKDSLTLAMFKLIKCCPDKEMIDAFLPYVSTLHLMAIREFMEKYFKLAALENKKVFLNKEIISQNEELSKYVTAEYLKLSLNEAEVIQLEARLKTKKAYARANIMKVLANQSRELVEKSYERLSASKTKAIQESAQELKQLVPEYFDEVQAPKVEIKGREEGYSLYEPRKYYGIEYPSQLKVSKKGLIIKKECVDISFLQVMTKQQVMDYIKLWNQRILDHAQDEYEVFGEYRQVGQRGFFPINHADRTLNGLPLGEVWRSYFKEDSLSPDAAFQLLFLTYAVGKNWTPVLPANIELFILEEKEIGAIEYYGHYKTILLRYLGEVDQSSFADKALQFLELMNRYAKCNQYKLKDYAGRDVVYSIAHMDVFHFMTNQLKLREATNEEFTKRFPVLYESYKKFHLECDDTTQLKLYINPLVWARAVHLKLIPREVLYEALLDSHMKYEAMYYRRTTHNLFEGYRDAYFHGRGIYGKPDFSVDEKEKDAILCLREALDKIADTLLPMESVRLNEDTEVTGCVQGLRVIRGMKYLIMTLRVLEGEEIKRQNSGHDRNTVFTNVIRNCYPMEGDSFETLKQERFSEKRLVEAAMLAPQWIDIINDVLQWDGFKEACYYFIAHMKQYEYEKKKAEIVQYTDIEPGDLNDGAFDMGWCKSIYKSLGEKRFTMIYQAAKFLCDNSFHTRARKYADACMGKTEKEAFLTQAKEKRNKDALNAYCICPVENDKDLLERYLYVRQFQKETKAFGAQRQASEKRACEIALMNLARNSRFETVTRLSWIMETEVIQQYSSFLHAQQVEDIEVWIEIDAFGKNEICVKKNGKALKSIPTKLKNNEKILEIKEVHTLFNNQYKRSKQMLQTAMEERVVFGKEEMEAIMHNPVVAPMLQTLVLKNGEHFGFFEEGKLKGLSETYEIEGDIFIAHPYDFHKAGVWKAYQKYVFETKMVQPFKQIFRELYLKLDDEVLQSSTKRYSGYQIQPQKAAGALKNRRWNASYESGLERVYHKEDLVVCLYADADWFSPSDIEAPSIDYVAFYHRKNHEPKKIEEIDDVIYSEIMRDVDLAVSTACVGGVDPITSFSTIELRKAIVEYTCELMKLKNVTVSEHFANIEGQHNNYHVHLGSGMIHQDGGGSVHMVPVYSGKRGKVYLPFLDEDPMSAQILTKVIMLAEDVKIKDPAILNQIVTRKE